MVRNRSGGPPGVYDRLGDPFIDLGRVEGYFKSPRRVGRSFGRYGTGRGTLLEVRDGLGDPLCASGRVEGLSKRSETGRGTLPRVWDGWGSPPKGLRWVGRPTQKSGMG